MIKAMALLVGVKHVDRLRYNGWDGISGCWGCELDVDNMERILSSLGYQTYALKTQQATSNNILSNLNNIARQLNRGDIFVFYYSGHGGQQPDRNGDELDGKDETFVAYDRQIIDDEIDNIWVKIPAGVRIVMISDSCNSGSNYRGIMNISTSKPMIAMKNTSARKMQAQLLHFSGCRDGYTSAGYYSGGAFTKTLCETWSHGDFRGNYEEFHDCICKNIQRMLYHSGVENPQQPQLNKYGPVSDEFKAQSPFEIGEEVITPDILQTQEYKNTLTSQVNVSKLNVRSGPGIHYEIVDRLSFGDNVQVLNISGNDIWVEFEPGKWAAFATRGKKFMELE